MYEKNDDNIVGGILTYSIDIEMLLDTLWVLKNYRNQGVGKNLVKSIEKTACYK
ncbi:MAG: GNAT family N-acetyltransferase [Francisellaceae bacterium]|nr:GNAT family N-acetyltransferase [Francisellaceae bacterium]MBT6206819.1 GNAT family N-acetyltransferase [Francisellaceae bacterium]MBT6538810.1 GNAT family N-acetyltransferase [Francisellaceae bacterium]